MAKDSERNWPNVLQLIYGAGKVSPRRACGIALLGFWLPFLAAITTVSVHADDQPPSARTTGTVPAELWRLDRAKSVNVLQGARRGVNTSTDSAVEYRIDSLRNASAFILRMPLPPVVPTEDLRAELTADLPFDGSRFGWDIIFPNQKDPRTGDVLTAVLPGTADIPAGQPTDVTVRTSRQAIARLIRELRLELHQPELNTSEMLINGLVLSGEAHRGSSRLRLGSVRLSGTVSRGSIEVDGTQVSTTDDAAPERDTALSESAVKARCAVERGELRYSGRPAMLRLIPDHGDSPEWYRDHGFTAVWVRDASDTARIRALSDAGLIVAATPPHPRFDPADFDRPITGLAPLNQTFSDPDLWYLGTRVRPDQFPHLLSWAREVRVADRLMARPLMADVTSHEGVAGREVDIVSFGRPTIGRATTLREFRDDLMGRRRTSGQVGVPFTWIQTEAPDSLQWWRESLKIPPWDIDPDQIAAQAFAVVSAGGRGIGYWQTLAGTTGQNRTAARAAMALTNLRLQLVEDYLINGRVETHVSMQRIAEPNSGAAASAADQSPAGALFSGVSGAVSGQRRTGGNDIEADAAVISVEGRSLVIVCDWDDESHFVAANSRYRNISATVAASETASAWLITPVDVIGLPRRMSAGGLRIELRDFDRLACVLITSDPSEIDRLRQRVYSTAPKAAELQVRIAAETLRDLRAMLPALRDLSEVWSEAVSAVDAATVSEEAASQLLSQGRYADAFRRAAEAVRFLRHARTLLWKEAIRQLPTPTAGPYTTDFALLPRHLEMAARLRSAGPDVPDILRTGGFETHRVPSDHGWEPAPQDRKETVSASIVTTNGGRLGNVLRIQSWGSPSGLRGSDPVPVISTPPLPVGPDDIVVLTGVARVTRDAGAASSAALSIWDTELGPEYSVQPTLRSDWRRFSVYRTASGAAPLKFRFGLTPGARAELDDLQVRVVPRDSLSVPALPTGHSRRRERSAPSASLR